MYQVWEYHPNSNSKVLHLISLHSFITNKQKALMLKKLQTTSIEHRHIVLANNDWKMPSIASWIKLKRKSKLPNKMYSNSCIMYIEHLLSRKEQALGLTLSLALSFSSIVRSLFSFISTVLLKQSASWKKKI